MCFTTIKLHLNRKARKNNLSRDITDVTGAMKMTGV